MSNLVYTQTEVQPPSYSPVTAYQTHQPDQFGTVPLDQQYDESHLRNFSDPHYVSNFSGNLIGGPEIGAYLSEGWQFVKRYVFAFALWTFVQYTVLIVSWLPNYYIRTSSNSVAFSILGTVLSVSLYAIQMIWYFVGVRFVLTIMKRDPNEHLDILPQLELLFSSQRGFLIPANIVKMIILYIIYSILVAIGFLLLIIPGIWAAVSFGLSLLIFTEYHEDLPSSIVDSLRISMNVVSKNWCSWFLFFLVCGLISIFIIPAPIAFVAIVISFREAIGLRPFVSTSEGLVS